jgi:ABC-2 type transport system permease protein
MTLDSAHPSETADAAAQPAGRPRVRFPALAAFGGLLLRDARVLTRERWYFVIRTVSQPLLLVFVFTYVFPTIGQELRAFGGQASFSDVLVPGVLAITMMIKGVQAVALPLVDDFGHTREIEDRVMAPLPVWAVAVQKIVSGALQGVLAVLVVFPIVALVPAEPLALAISWPHLLTVGVLAPFVGASVGLALGTLVTPKQVPMMFSVIILPVTFLGATYFPWTQLDPIPWLQWLVLANPLVYFSEGFRMALTPLAHMAPLGVYTGMVVCGGLAMGVGVWGFRRRVLA